MVGTVEDFVARQRNGQSQEMNALDRQICGEPGRSKYVVIPVGLDGPQTRRVAQILVALASDMEQLARRIDLTPRSRLLHIEDTIMTANYEIKRTLGRHQRKRTSRDNFSGSSPAPPKPYQG